MVPAEGEPPSAFARHLAEPNNPGRVEKPDGEGVAVNPACGDELRLSLRIQDGTVSEARFQATGCAATLAAGSALTLLLQGCRLESIADCASAEHVAQALGGLPRLRRHAAVLASQAAAAAAHSAAARTETQ